MQMGPTSLKSQCAAPHTMLFSISTMLGFVPLDSCLPCGTTIWSSDQGLPGTGHKGADKRAKAFSWVSQQLALVSRDHDRKSSNTSGNDDANTRSVVAHSAVVAYTLQVTDSSGVCGVDSSFVSFNTDIDINSDVVACVNNRLVHKTLISKCTKDADCGPEENCLTPPELGLSDLKSTKGLRPSGYVPRPKQPVLAMPRQPRPSVFWTANVLQLWQNMSHQCQISKRPVFTMGRSCLWPWIS